MLAADLKVEVAADVDQFVDQAAKTAGVWWSATLSPAAPRPDRCECGRGDPSQHGDPDPVSQDGASHQKHYKRFDFFSCWIRSNGSASMP
ncbi:MAG: hypothetical protein QOC58_1841 [Mycobacterium sp.]|nr:hypothetical protein [Mycobacterium sp.]